jgi:hypothetical protein
MCPFSVEDAEVRVGEASTVDDAVRLVVAALAELAAEHPAGEN